MNRYSNFKAPIPLPKVIQVHTIPEHHNRDVPLENRFSEATQRLQLQEHSMGRDNRQQFICPEATLIFGSQTLLMGWKLREECVHSDTRTPVVHPRLSQNHL